MKKVLIIAYYFPPIGGGGVTRPLKFFKYLPEYNWIPSILTVKSGNFWVMDHLREEQITNKKNVHRTYALTAFNLLNFFKKKNLHTARNSKMVNRYRKLSDIFLIPDPYIGWYPFALRSGIKLLKEQKFDLILATSPPPTTLLIGYRLSKLFNIPFIADFRDLWVNEYFYNPPTVLHHKLHKYLEYKILKRAKFIICISESMQKFFKKQYSNKLSVEKIKVISNGFDGKDFENLSLIQKNDKIIKFLHTGSLTISRTIEPLAVAFKRLIDKKKINPEYIKVTLVGRRDDVNDKIIKNYHLDEIFELKNSVSHKEALKLQKSSNILLLIGNKVRHELNSMVLTGKIFEYLASNRPIFGIVPKNSETDKLINRANAGVIGDIYDIYDIETKLLHLINNYRSGKYVHQPDIDFIKNLEYKKITSKLSELFNDAAEEKG